MPMPQLLSNFLDCFSCCGQGAKDARHDQYLQPLTLLQPQPHAVSGALAVCVNAWGCPAACGEHVAANL